MKYITLYLFVFFSVITNIQAQKLVKKLDNAHIGEIQCLAINNDGTWLLTGGVDKRVYLWETASGKKLKAFGSHADKVTAVAFNTSAKTFVTASADKRIIVWNSADGKPKSILSGHTAAITAVAFNPLSDAMVSADQEGKAILWDETNRQLGTLSGHSKAITGLAYSPDGKYIVTGSLDNTIKIWDAQSISEYKSISVEVKGINAVAFSADGRYVAAGCNNGSVLVCDAKTGNVLMTLSDFKSSVRSVCFSPDVQYITGAGDDNRIVFYALESQQIVKDLPAHSKGITAIAYSDKNNQFVSVGNDASIMIWDVTDLNIGKKKFIADKSSGVPRITCSAITLKENNANGIIEQNDNPVISFTIKNEGSGQAYDLAVVPVLTNTVKGLVFDKEYSIGNLAPGKSQKVEIPVIITEELETAGSTFKITVTEANGKNSDPIILDFQTKGSVNAYIMITGFEYTSPTGKAELTTPITLKLKLLNLTNGKASNIKVNFKLPTFVIATDKLSETIGDMEANAKAEASITFYADKTYTLDSISVKAEIENAYSSNVKDINLTLKVGKELPVNPELLAINTDENQPQMQMRGGVDPLKGLNVAKAQTQMQVGDYYALIIGMDKYKGSWAPLKNAVADAKAVENMMRTKYKFEHFKTLYNEQATRENIINEMEWLVANVKAKDNVLIFYSGHGDFKQELNKGYWVPIDAETNSTSKFISNSDIQTFLGGIKSKHTLLVSDACFSGDLFRGNTVSTPFDGTEKYYIKVNDLTSRQAISSGGIEPVMDGGKDGHSVFAYYFLKSLENNQNKYMDARQLFEKVNVPVTNNSEQTPNFSPIKNTGDEGGQFIFIKK